MQAENLVSAFFITQERTFLISELLRQDPSLTCEFEEIIKKTLQNNLFLHSIADLLGIKLPHVFFLKKVRSWFHEAMSV